MAARNYTDPSAPPPYSSVVNSEQYADRMYPDLRQQRTPEFDEFVNRYESKCVYRCTRM